MYSQDVRHASAEHRKQFEQYHSSRHLLFCFLNMGEQFRAYAMTLGLMYLYREERQILYESQF